jgi:hypothetical protein
MMFGLADQTVGALQKSSASLLVVQKEVPAGG